MAGGRIPDRWLEFEPYGEVIAGIFVPLKTPLAANIHVPPGEEFTPLMFLQDMRHKGLDIGLVINLCQTTRFYDGREFEYHNIQYRHIVCRGQVRPGPEEEVEFARTCNEFLAVNEEKIIAVHCTHGCNRTGFMICAYLNAFKGWPMSAAIDEFARQRPPGIYRGSYLRILRSLDSDEMMPPHPHNQEGNLPALSRRSPHGSRDSHSDTDRSWRD